MGVRDGQSLTRTFGVLETRMGRKNRQFAAIDIGSHRLQMKIVEISREGRVRDLENVDLLVPLGRDTFSDGKLSFESVRATCDAIAGFARLMKDYGVVQSRVVATSALREASNRDYMIDQIRMLTGFDVEIINNAQEKFLTLQAVKQRLMASPLVSREEALLVLDIGAGSIQLSLFEGMHLVTSQSMKIGALRIQEAMSRIEQHTLRFASVLEEYIEAHVESVEPFRGSGLATRFAVVTGESEAIARLSAREHQADLVSVDGMTVIPRELFERVYHKAVDQSAEELAARCGISQAGADVIAPALILIRKFFDKSGTQEVILPHVTLVDGLVAEYAGTLSDRSEQAAFEADILSNAVHMARRYAYNSTHTAYVVQASLLLFDKLRPIHGMKPRDRFLLHVAALLHDIGKFIAADPITSIPTTSSRLPSWPASLMRSLPWWPTLHASIPPRNPILTMTASERWRLRIGSRP
jgi:exopolyphosphatase / guanosine-5'-triphosphate,3'-diphosphate pyrophosphatase